jgi:hypothetical protein
MNVSAMLCPGLEVKEVFSNHVIRKEVMKTLLVTVIRKRHDDYHLLGDDNHHSHRRGNLKSYRKRHADQVFSDHAGRKRVEKKEVPFVATWIGRR